MECRKVCTQIEKGVNQFSGTIEVCKVHKLNGSAFQMGIMSSTSQQNGYHAKRAKLYNSKVTVVLGECHPHSIFRFCDAVYCGKFLIISVIRRDNSRFFFFLSCFQSTGAQWGDEGKGKVVDMLATDVDVVCRCQVSDLIQNIRLLLVSSAFGARICSRPRQYEHYE